MKKLIIGALIGNIMEFYDFIIYAYFSQQIAAQFFISSDPFISTLLTFTVFASGYLTRPLGAIYFGSIGDKLGRKKALVLSIGLITLSTAAIGVLPSYQSIGYLAPILLVMCRLFQGFAVSGEQSGAAVYLSENVNQNRHGLVGGLVLGSSYFGVLLGSLVCLMITLVAPSNWRMPFLLSIPLGIISLIIRLQASDSHEFNRLKNSNLINKSPIKSIFKDHFGLLIKMILLTGSLAVPIYLYVVHLPSFLITTVGLTQNMSLIVSSCSLLFISVLVPAIGLVSDKIGYVKTLKFGYIAAIILSYPSYWLLQSKTLPSVFCMQLIMGIVIAMIAGPMFALFVRSFPSNIRFSGVSFAFNVGMSLFGGTAPMFATLMIGFSGNNAFPSLYIIGSSIIGFFILSKLTKDKYLEGLKINTIDSNIADSNADIRNDLNPIKEV